MARLSDDGRRGRPSGPVSTRTIAIIASGSILSAAAAGFVLRGAAAPESAIATQPAVTVSVTPPDLPPLPVPGPSLTVGPSPLEGLELPVPGEDTPSEQGVAPGSVERVCATDIGPDEIVPAGRTGPTTVRLSDELPASSAVPRFEPILEMPVQLRAHPDAEFPLHHPPGTRQLVDAGARTAFVRSFVDPENPGGYSVTAYEFAGPRQARAGLAAAVRSLVCEYGASPVTFEDLPEIVASTTNVVGGSTHAWWVHGARVVAVDYAMYGDHEVALREAHAAIRHAWQVGDAGQHQG